MELPTTEVIEERCSSALHKLKRKTPYGWDLNIYKGCSHGCVYCFALYSHPELIQNKGSRVSDADVFSTHIHVKKNVVDLLERELSAPNWNHEVVNIGGVTDSYQPNEEHYRFMPDILRLLVKYRTPAIISTKATLILRDFNLIDQLSRITYVNVAATITTMDESVRALIEPGAAPSINRVSMLKEFRKTNASVGLHAMPLIPGLTDTSINLEALFSAAKEANVHYLLPGTLYLRGKTRPAFFREIEHSFPQLCPRLKALYQSGSANAEYKNGLYTKINELRLKYGVSSSWSGPMKEKLNLPQLELF